jgi:type III secretory pathway component EscS
MMKTEVVNKKEDQKAIVIIWSLTALIVSFIIGVTVWIVVGNVFE